MLSLIFSLERFYMIGFGVINNYESPRETNIVFWRHGQSYFSRNKDPDATSGEAKIEVPEVL